MLLDKLEQMDVDTLNEFGAWLEQEGLQAIATRVSTGDECSIIIEDDISDKSYYFKMFDKLLRGREEKIINNSANTNNNFLNK